MDGHRDVFIACSVGDLYWLKRSLPGRERLIGKIVNQEGLTPLHIAARHRHIKVLEYLLEHCHGVDTSIASYVTGETPLHSVLSDTDMRSQNDAVKCLKLLIQNGANCKKANRNRQTPLHLAAQNGLPETVRILLSNGADITVKDFNNHTPCDLATLYGHHECSRLLGALHWAKNKDADTETQIQYERASKQQTKIRKSLETELRKQEADQAYRDWIEQNRISPIDPPSNSLLRVTERAGEEKSNCQTCQHKLSSESNLNSRTLSAASNKRKPMVAKIDISLDQSDYNIESVGKPHKLYPYKNYPPHKYRKHKHQVTSQSRPNSSLSGLYTQTRPSSRRSVKSVPTPRLLATPTPKTDSSLGDSISVSPLPYTIHKPHMHSGNWENKDIHSKISHQSELMNTIESVCLNGNHDNNNINGLDNDDNNTETNTQNCEEEREKEEEGHSEGSSTSFEGEGSSTSIEGLTFHEVGPENNLQTLISPKSPEGQPLVNPADLIEFLRLSQQKPHRRRSLSYHRFSSHSMNHTSPHLRFQRRLSLGSIPEGKIYDKYDEDEEGSRIFDFDFLFSLMPYAFERQFQSTEEDDKEVEMTEETDNNGETDEEKNTTLEVTPSLDYIHTVNTIDKQPESSITTQSPQAVPLGSSSHSTLKVVTVAWDEDTSQVVTKINEQELSPRKGKGVTMTKKITALNAQPTKQSPALITPSLPMQTQLASKSTYSLVPPNVTFPNSIPSTRRVKSAIPKLYGSQRQLKPPPKEKSIQKQSKRQLGVAVKPSVYQFGGNLIH